MAINSGEPEAAKASADQDLEAWNNARQYAGLLGNIPTSFTSITRSLVHDGSKGDGELSQGTSFLMTRLLKGNAVLAPFFYMSEALFPDEFENRVYISSREMMDLYKPFDLAAFVTTIYVAKKLAVICPAGEWSYVSQGLQKSVDIGLQLGAFIPAISIGTGLLVSCMAQLGLGVFLLHDAKGFMEYRRTLGDKIGQSLDHKWEISRWGCTSAHIGSIFIQYFGLGVPAAHAFLRGILEPSHGLSTETDNEVYKYKIAKIWIDSLVNEGKIPNIAHRGRFYPEGEEIEALLERVAQIRESSDQDWWLNKTKESISPERTPILFKVTSSKGHSAESDATTASYEDEDGDPFNNEDPFGPS